ncbi:cell division cycle 42 [Mycena filopes]|nr:cell division cycle 42 [Mycena filopes]
MNNYRKCIVLGNRAVGKTSMLTSYHKHSIPSHYIPSPDNYPLAIVVGETSYMLSIWDTPVGGEDYDRLRPLSYPQTDVFLICFKVTSLQSFEDIRTKWVPEIQRHCPGVPFLVVATQIDLRDNHKAALDSPAITTEQGSRLAHQLGAAQYVECSALTEEGLSDVFDEARPFSQHSSG